MQERAARPIPTTESAIPMTLRLRLPPTSCRPPRYSSAAPIALARQFTPLEPERQVEVQVAPGPCDVQAIAPAGHRARGAVFSSSLTPSGIDAGTSLQRAAVVSPTTLLRWASRRDAEGLTSTRDQIAKASSWNAVAKRRPAGSSSASS
jgi:hypothetical protein